MHTWWIPFGMQNLIVSSSDLQRYTQILKCMSDSHRGIVWQWALWWAILTRGLKSKFLVKLHQANIKLWFSWGIAVLVNNYCCRKACLYSGLRHLVNPALRIVAALLCVKLSFGIWSVLKIWMNNYSLLLRSSYLKVCIVIFILNGNVQMIITNRIDVYSILMETGFDLEQT